ncbi:hypothetical protein DH2020_025423 [Rehmannia glutinosa]|uniref:Cell wall hydroxyproline-rich glycoprotein n=1 Tax=Rehmannia glutinosa TaxID=99300 RepID=A0ABR0W1J6_REHGL
MKEMLHHYQASKILFLCTTFLLLFNISTQHQLSISVDHRVNQRRHLLSYNGDPLAIEPWLKFENPRLKNAYIALQAWKEAILSDPKNITANWVGPDPCNYKGVFCWPAPDNPCERTVAGIDINHADIAGNLPHELGLLYDLAIFHLNSNRFCGTIPPSFVNMNLLSELDLSNNRFAGKFPELILQLPSLTYLDIRYNEFEGQLPTGLFEKKFDAIFLNHNRFSFALPDNIGNFARDAFRKFRQHAVFKPIDSHKQRSFVMFPAKSKLTNLTVLDLSYNRIIGPLPDSIGDMISLEQLNVAHNLLSGKISTRICELPNLANFAYDHNFFSDEAPVCLKLPKFNSRMNCFKGRPKQRSDVQCRRFLSQMVNCSSFNCDTSFNPSPVYSPPPSLQPPFTPPHPPSPSASPPPPPFFSPPPPGNPQPPPPAPINSSPSPTPPPIISSPPPPTPPLCPCVKPPPPTQQSDPPSIS